MARGQPPASPLQVFVHLHKTGGQTLRLILRNLFGDEGVLMLDYPHAAERLATYRASAIRQQRVRVVAAHFEYGIEAEFGPSAQYFTMLRHPTSRLLSQYAYGRREEPWRERVQGMTLAEFVDAEDIGLVMHNRQTRLLGDSPHGPVRAPTVATLENAKRALEHKFAVVGVTERFEESVMLMHHALSWPRWPFYERRNVSADRPDVDDVPDKLLAAIAARNELDLELYEWASGRLERALDEAGIRFRLDVKLFERLNGPSGKRWRPDR